MSRRSKSLGRQAKGILPDLNSSEDRPAIKAKQRSLRDLSRSNANLPSTSALRIANGHLSTYMSSSSLGPRSVFSRRNTTYGRNENSEVLNDVRDQLLDAKKQIAELNQKNKVLNTRLNRVTRESERREAHLQSIMIGRFQPAELNDTHLAVTLTSLEKKRLENEHIINAQAKRIRELEKVGHNGEDTANEESGDDYSNDFDNENEEAESETNGKAAKLTVKDVPDKWIEKHKKTKELAKAYAEQNKELKARYRQLSAQLSETKHKLKTREDVPKSKRVSTADVNRIMQRIHENGLLRQQVDAISKEYQKELDEKSAEIKRLENIYNNLKSEMDNTQEKIKEQLEEVNKEHQLLEEKKNKIQHENNIRELQREQLSGEITDLEEERKRMNDERDEWTRMKTAYEKQQIALEMEIRHLEDVIENLRRDNTNLRKRMTDLLQATIGDAQVSQRVLEIEREKSSEATPSRPKNIPRLEMHDLSVDIPSPELPSVSSHTSQLPPSASAIWDARINFLAPGIVAHIIRQDALMVALEKAKNK